MGRIQEFVVYNLEHDECSMDGNRSRVMGNCSCVMEGAVNDWSILCELKNATGYRSLV